MCGIAGFIGRPASSYMAKVLATEVLRGLEARGKDACGFFACTSDMTFGHKSPDKASSYTLDDPWRAAALGDADVFVMHARGATPNQGPPSENANNHPFVSRCGTHALVHNGKVKEYSKLKSQYKLESECDSELILRLIESKAGDMTERVARTLADLPTSSVAMAVAGHIEDRPQLYLYRNAGRPLCVIDMTGATGQYWFCSTKKIWDAAVRRAFPDEQPYYEVIELAPNTLVRFGPRPEPFALGVGGFVNKLRGLFRRKPYTLEPLS